MSGMPHRDPDERLACGVVLLLALVGWAMTGAVVLAVVRAWNAP